jgi:hypothetical protein
VRLTVDGRIITPLMLGRFVRVSKDEAAGEIALRYALPRRMTRETTDEVEYTLSWRGDEVVGIAPNSDFFPFYGTMERGG